MKKKVLASIVFLVVIFDLIIMGQGVKAYSNDDFSIDIPSTYKSSGTNVWGKSNGDNINVQINSYDEDITESLDKYFEDIIEEIEKEDMYSSIDTKEIIKITKNDYKCAHITAKLSGYSLYADQYLILSDKNVYTITFTSSSKSYFSSDEAEDILDSFTIKDYKEPKVKSKSGEMAESVADGAVRGVIIGAVIGAVVGIIMAIKKKSKKNV